MTVLVLAAAAGAQEPLAAAEAKMKARNWRGAADDYGRIIKKSPGDVRGYLGRARALVMLGEHDAAIADCDKALAIEESVLAYRVRGDALRGEREDAEALKAYDLAVKMDPLDVQASLGHAKAKEALRDFSAAAAEYWGHTVLEPKNPAIRALCGKALMHIDEPRAAVESFVEAVALEKEAGPKRVHHACCARAWWEANDQRAANAEAQKAHAEPAPPEALAEVGRFYFDTGRTKEAAADFRKAIGGDPDGQEATRLYLFLARARLGERPAATGELKAHLDGRARKDDWYAQVAGFLCGAAKEEALLAAAKAGNPQIAIERECDACWYAGAVRLLDGDAAGAKALLERCLATNVRTLPAYDSAKMALAAMK